MLKYIFKQSLILIFLLAGAMFIVFMFLHLSPGSRDYGNATPEAMAIWEWREMHGLNDPLLIQYARYMAGIFRGDLGNSHRTGAPITQEVMQRLPHTLRLSFITLSFSLLVALPMGIIAAVKRNTWIDKMSMIIVLIGISIPVMWLGVILIYLNAMYIGGPPLTPGRHWNSFILPIITLGTAMMAAIIRSTRSSVLEAMGQNYIRTAQAKGLSGGKVIRKHILPNIIIPVLTSFKANLGVFFTGILMVEITFAWPGIGLLMIQGISARDRPMFLGSLFMLILFFALLNFAVDIIKAFADPRMRRGSLC